MSIVHSSLDEVMSKSFTISKHRNHQTVTLDDLVAIEEPLEIRIEGRSIAVLMRQPHRIEDIELVTGFLLTEGVIEDKEDIRAIEHITDPVDPKYNTVDVILASGVPAKRRHSADRNLFASSSCGICGKATQDRIWQHFSPLPDLQTLPSDAWICQAPTVMRKAQQQFHQTGGTHAAALFTQNGNCWFFVKMGRHNAVDKAIGGIQRIIRKRPRPAGGGRVAFEIAQDVGIWYPHPHVC